MAASVRNITKTSTRRYSAHCRNYDNNRLFKIASGASDYDYEWTKVLMKRVGQPHGRSFTALLHRKPDGPCSKGSATQFDKDDYYWTMGKCREIEDVIRKHCAIMDEYDKDKNVALMLDEWGTWWDEEPGTSQRTPVPAKHHCVTPLWLP